MSGHLEILPRGEHHPAWRGLTEADLWPTGAGEPDDELGAASLLAELPPGSPVAQHAILYAAMGWEIMPRIAGRAGVLIDALRGSPRTGQVGEDEVSAYWAQHPETPALGVVCGPRSGVVVIDVDQHPDGADGLAELARLEDRHGRLPAAPTVLSPSGRGRHLYLRWPTKPIRTGQIAPGVEVLADRAAATLPPSSKRGRPYRWKLDRHPDFLQPPAAPEWLLALAAWGQASTRPRAERNAITAPSRYVETAIAREVEAVRGSPPGSRNCQLSRSAWSLGRFVRDGAASSDTISGELLAAATAAGLPLHEALPTIRSVL